MSTLELILNDLNSKEIGTLLYQLTWLFIFASGYLLAAIFFPFLHGKNGGSSLMSAVLLVFSLYSLYQTFTYGYQLLYAKSAAFSIVVTESKFGPDMDDPRDWLAQDRLSALREISNRRYNQALSSSSSLNEYINASNFFVTDFPDEYEAYEEALRLMQP